MSNYHLKMERGGSKEAPNIDMPEIKEEAAPAADEEVKESALQTPEGDDPYYEAKAPTYDKHENSQEESENTGKSYEASQSSQESSNTKNIRALREKAERADKIERELEEMRRKMETYEAATRPKEAPQPAPEEEDYHINPDDLVEGKHLSKYEKKIKALESQWNQYSVEQRLRSEYKDFDHVVTEQNLASLSKKYPQVANTLKAPGELYDKAVAAYTVIKNLGIYVEDNYGADKERAQKNASKPRPLTSVSPQQGDSPLSNANAFANGLTDELKAKLHREMTDAMKNY